MRIQTGKKKPQECDSRGAVFTKPEVVDFILDLAGYSPDQDLAKRRVLEPAGGDGAFADALVGRLMASYLARGGSRARAEKDLAACVKVTEIHAESAQNGLERMVRRLVALGVAPAAARRLAAGWMVRGDFLLADIPGKFDYVVGNPPYVRQELIPDALLAAYRSRYGTLYNRADLYVPFFERGLGLLSERGKLCFICSDRWMKCAYGRPLRALVADKYRLEAFVDMVGTPAFQSEVIAYPAITLLSRETHGGRDHQKVTMAAYRPPVESAHLSGLASGLRGGKASEKLGVRKLVNVACGGEPWLLDADDRLSLVRRIEEKFRPIEEEGCQVGIGVATGADRAFIGPFDELDVEPERKLPLVMASDIRSGRVSWGGRGVVNPFEPDGSVADLRRYPRFANYVNERAEQIRKRNVAKRSGQNWYRTIDRIHDHLAGTRKLLIPDIKGEPNVVLEDGGLYPHHNLYWVTSSSWTLPTLQAVLRSTVAKMFVSAYGVKMAGGCLRFQAQYLRRIRIPSWDSVRPETKRALARAAETLDQDDIDDASFALYGLRSADVAAVERFRRSPTTN